MAATATAAVNATTTTIGVGFGTAALGSNTYSIVTMALAAGFRKFDTAEADWYVLTYTVLCIYCSSKYGYICFSYFECKEFSISLPPISPTVLTLITDNTISHTF